MTRLALLLVGLLTSSAAWSEVIEYEIYEIAKSGNRLVVKGKRDYSVREVKVATYNMGDRKSVHKLIDLQQGFALGTRNFHEKDLTGFGLLARRGDRYDFSFEWYDKVAPNRFRRLEAGGTVLEVQTIRGANVEELTEVRFLSDTHVRFNADPNVPDNTHFVLVKAGSVLRLR
jgi:hypothetical protein